MTVEAGTVVDWPLKMREADAGKLSDGGGRSLKRADVATALFDGYAVSVIVWVTACA